ncbi:MAG: Hsp20/alpha crystallin family protein [Caulobacterales bacterium]
MSSDPRQWMWANALDALAQAEHLHRRMFEPMAARASCWEPPVDVIETDREVLVLAALPGVSPDSVEAVIKDGALIIAGHRTLPPELRVAVIHRLELPQGRFERRILLPAGRYGAVRRADVNGCLVITLSKAA